MNIKIVRIESSSEGTFGSLLIDGRAFCVTLELPWLDNQAKISCIPIGNYICHLLPSPLIERITKGRWKDGWVLQNVLGRINVMIHPGNIVEDTLGCIITAQYFGKLRGDRAVLNSGQTFDEFMLITRKQFSLELEIKDA